MRHTLEVRALQGYSVEADIASTTGGNGKAKALSVVTVIGEVTTTLFRVTDRDERVCRDYFTLGVAVDDYNEL